MAVIISPRFVGSCGMAMTSGPPISRTGTLLVSHCPMRLESVRQCLTEGEAHEREPRLSGSVSPVANDDVDRQGNYGDVENGLRNGS